MAGINFNACAEQTYRNWPNLMYIFRMHTNNPYKLVSSLSLSLSLSLSVCLCNTIGIFEPGIKNEKKKSSTRLESILEIVRIVLALVDQMYFSVNAFTYHCFIVLL